MGGAEAVPVRHYMTLPPCRAFAQRMPCSAPSRTRDCGVTTGRPEVHAGGLSAKQCMNLLVDACPPRGQGP